MLRCVAQCQRLRPLPSSWRAAAGRGCGRRAGAATRNSSCSRRRDAARRHRARARAFVRPERILIVTAADQVAEVRGAVPGCRRENIVVEPKARNTAPSSGSARWVPPPRRRPAVLAVLPADPYIGDEARFAAIVRAAIAEAASAITTSASCRRTRRPASATSGSAHQSERGARDRCRRPVGAFVEKPDRATAERTSPGAPPVELGHVLLRGAAPGRGGAAAPARARRDRCTPSTRRPTRRRARALSAGAVDVDRLRRHGEVPRGDVRPGRLRLERRRLVGALRDLRPPTTPATSSSAARHRRRQGNILFADAGRVVRRRLASRIWSSSRPTTRCWSCRSIARRTCAPWSRP